MEVYVDDMIIKSTRATDHPRDLQEAFEILNRFNMKLNPDKCTFGVKAGKFLGFMISQRGIEAKPEKIKAILEMQAPTSIHEVQQLDGRITNLGQFISSSAKRCMPFYRTLN